MELGSPCWAREDRELTQNKRSFSGCLGIFLKVPVLRKTNQTQLASVIIVINLGNE